MRNAVAVIFGGALMCSACVGSRPNLIEGVPLAVMVQMVNRDSDGDKIFLDDPASAKLNVGYSARDMPAPKALAHALTHFGCTFTVEDLSAVSGYAPMPMHVIDVEHHDAYMVSGCDHPIQSKE